MRGVFALALLAMFCSCSTPDLNKTADGSDNAETYFKRGSTKFNRGDYKGAIADYDKALGLNPNFAIAYFNRGVAKYSSGDYKDALADWERAIELNPAFKSKLQPLIDKAKTKMK